MAKVNEAARNPEVRKILFQRIKQPRSDWEAFEVLYDLYFGVTFAEALEVDEREAMQKILTEAGEAFFTRPFAETKAALEFIKQFKEPPPIELLERMLDWFDPQAKVEDKNLRRLASATLLNFLPTHPGVYYLVSFKKSVSKMRLHNDFQETRENLVKLVEAMKKRKERDREATADCHE
ncbi:MAG: hypothetical protein Q8Q46_03345 [Candidatus Giovannonibacteria bacterium]|nr:hypothetical protein [Candidatus Giovannonibacteria bacterium]